jgi:hypothetical protein
LIVFIKISRESGFTLGLRLNYALSVLVATSMLARLSNQLLPKVANYAESDSGHDRPNEL